MSSIYSSVDSINTVEVTCNKGKVPVCADTPPLFSFTHLATVTTPLPPHTTGPAFHRPWKDLPV